MEEGAPSAKSEHDLPTGTSPTTQAAGPRSAARYRFFYSDDSVNAIVVTRDIIHGYLQPNGTPASLLVLDCQCWPVRSIDFGLVLAFEKSKVKNVQEAKPATHDSNSEVKWEPTKLQTLANPESSRDPTWKFILCEADTWQSSALVGESGSFRWTVLLERYDAQELDCRLWLYNKDQPVPFQFLSGTLTLNPSRDPTNQLRRYDVNNLALVGTTGLGSSRNPLIVDHGQFSPSATESDLIPRELEKFSSVDRLPPPGLTAYWDSLRSHFRALETTEPAPRHVWVTNNGNAALNIVASTRKPEASAEASASQPRYKLINTVCFGVATKKTLPPYSWDREDSSAVFLLGPPEDEPVVISIFDLDWKLSGLIHVSAGAGVRIDSVSKDGITYDLRAPGKNTPLFPIRINGNSRQLAKDNTTNAESKYILIQCYMLLELEQQEVLKQLGLSCLQYVSKNTYLYRRNDVSLDRIRQLHFVAFADIYEKLYKLAIGPGETSFGTRGAQPGLGYNVDVIFHVDVDPLTLRAIIADTAHLEASTLEFANHKLRATVRKEYLADLASIDEVRVIEQVYEATPSGNRAW